MTAVEWLIVIALGVLALWILAGVIDELAARRPRPPVPQPVRPVPPAPSTWARGDLTHGRPLPAGNGRHRRPEEPAS